MLRLVESLPRSDIYTSYYPLPEKGVSVVVGTTILGHGRPPYEAQTAPFGREHLRSAAGSEYEDAQALDCYLGTLERDLTHQTEGWIPIGVWASHWIAAGHITAEARRLVKAAFDWRTQLIGVRELYPPLLLLCLLHLPEAVVPGDLHIEPGTGRVEVRSKRLALYLERPTESVHTHLLMTARERDEGLGAEEHALIAEERRVHDLIAQGYSDLSRCLGGMQAPR